MSRTPVDRLADERLARLLRGRLMAAIHTGRVAAGGRLPSYREISDETGVDLRAVARAYALLESEGLVEVRGRSGVFLAEQKRMGGRVLAETARWFVAVAREAWHRRLRVPDLPEFVRECTASRVVRCAFVEGTVDQVASIGTELADDFGFEVSAVHADRFAPVAVDGAAPVPRTPAELREADFIATTAFHAREVQEIAAALEVPLVVIRLNPQFTREVERTLAERELVVVCVDPLFAERLKLIAGKEHPERVRTVLASDREAVARLDRSQPVLVSEAARNQLPDLTLPRSFPDQPMISPESADELVELLVRMNLEHGLETGPR
ncbi:GntR family transcriptional regulator [Longimicrobium sp.]|uniref:GntR family transcriptional regulator n=1 Tax=Longimicrobium sp. TaxID=2029185 RepID=UPI003B3B8FBE